MGIYTTKVSCQNPHYVFQITCVMKCLRIHELFLCLIKFSGCILLGLEWYDHIFAFSPFPELVCTVFTLIDQKTNIECPTSYSDVAKSHQLSFS